MTKIPLTLAICAMFSLTATAVSAKVQPASSPIVQSAELDTNELANGMISVQYRLDVADSADDYKDCDEDNNEKSDTSTSLQDHLNIAHYDDHDDHHEDNNPPKS
ncbi:MAG: hypothetical protein DRQ49_08120 [Gammaproteobacteria bacterium]|nr:MAG: hypothetical protein DRQ49_08120 [Gammaproteobacteria bacterium]RKZ74716.1 MAG: hypothetical protein DRQ57_10010 [Gammaproteobacteria bacterium]